MKFNAKYSAPRQDYGKPPVPWTPSEAPGLVYSYRLFPCPCGEATGWRITVEGVPVPACSEECADLLTKAAQL